jgi:hypothetical protein
LCSSGASTERTDWSEETERFPLFVCLTPPFSQATFPIYVVLNHLLHLFDAMGSNNTSKNIKNMRKAGFSDWRIVLYYQVRPL